MRRLTIIIASVFSPLMALAGVSSGGSTMKSTDFKDAFSADRQNSGGMAASELTIDRAGIGGHRDAVRFNDILPSGEVQFEVGAVAEGKIQNIKKFILKPSEFSSEEGAYLLALRQSAKLGKSWAIVIDGNSSVGTLKLSNDSASTDGGGNWGLSNR